MSLMMRRIAQLRILCYGVENGGCASGVDAEQNSRRGEEELDGYTEDTDQWAVKTQVEMPPGSGCEERAAPNMERDTRDLLSQLYRTHTGLCVAPTRSTSHPALASVRRVVERVLFKHRIAYDGMVQRLLEQDKGLESVNSVLSGVFGDGVISWGRIASVLALGAVVCEHLKQECEEERVEECVDMVVTHITVYLCTELQRWFISNNGWDGFVEYFHITDPESTVRNTLMAVAGLGIGACLISLMR